MLSPRVFVSSTFYDLRYVRENLKFFIKSMGYEPILNEDGAVFYDPSMHVQDSAIGEVSSCQMFVLIIGGRFGAKYKNNKSITNAEYERAVQDKIPVFALVEKSVLEEYHVYKANPKNETINYPEVDSTQIFDFIDSVKDNVVNNALFSFSDFEEMQTYLKHQWSGMVYALLTKESEAKKVNDMFTLLSETTKKIEFLTGQIVNSFGDQVTLLTVRIYDMLIGTSIMNLLSMWRVKISPRDIIRCQTLDELCNNQIQPVQDSESSVIYGGGPPYRLDKKSYESYKNEYALLHKKIANFLKENNITKEEYLKKLEQKPQPIDNIKQKKLL